MNHVPEVVERIVGPLPLVRAEEAADGTTTYLFAAPERASIERLRGNVRGWDGAPLPAVIDPRTSLCVLRLTLSALELARLGRPGPKGGSRERELRAAVGAPAAGPCRFGRNRRMGIDFGHPSVITCRVFGDLVPAGFEEPRSGLLEAIGRIMLARSGACTTPAFYYRLGAGSIRTIEVCAAAPDPVCAVRVRDLSRALAARAGEDRAILSALLETQGAWAA